jgi:RNA polymerase sigma-70 factor (ECF subfamily)
MDVLARFAAGDVEAFEPIFRQHQGQVYRWIVRIVRDRAAAEDLTVETFWRMYRSRARLNPSGNCAAWLRRVATNLAIDHLRRARPTESLVMEPADRPQADCVAQQETKALIRQAFSELPPRLRVVAQLRLIEDEPYWQIAESLGISLSAAKLRMFRAIRILRKNLEEHGRKP